MNKINKFLITIFTVLLVPTFARAATLSLTPSSGTFAVNSSVSVDVMLNNPTAQSIDGVDIFSLNYNPALLQIQDADVNTAGIQISANTAFLSDTAFNLVDTVAGKIKFSRIGLSGVSFNAASIRIATINFTVLASGSGNLGFDFTSGNTADCNITFSGNLGQDLLTATSGGTYTLGNGINPPTITTQPASQTVNPGSNVTFSVVASSSAPLSYQWRRNNVNITGQTSSSYVLQNAQSGDNNANFTVVVSNSAGSVTSQNAVLTVRSAPSITTQPTGQTVNLGQTATFSVVAAGTAPLSYQWRKNGTNIGGATSASYTTPATVANDNNANFSVVISNTVGNVTSQNATLTIRTAPTITTQPANQSVAVGQTATFSVVASGTAPLTYQWRKNGTNIAGATSASYTTPATVIGDNSAAFTVVVSNGAGNITSNPATLTVTQAVAPRIINQPLSQKVDLGKPVSFTVQVDGTAPFTFQWKRNGNDIQGATAASYSINSVAKTDDGSVFTVVITNIAGNITSNPATLSLNASNIAPTIVTQPEDQTAVQGNAAYFGVVATGGDILTYQWMKNGVEIKDANSPTYTTPYTNILDDGAKFTVRITNSSGNVTSREALLKVVKSSFLPACSSEMATSLLPIVAGSEVVLVDPSNPKGLNSESVQALASFTGSGTPVISHFEGSAVYGAPSALNFALVKTNSSGEMSWTINEQSETKSLTVGVKKDIPLTCYSNDDLKADAAALNKTLFTLKKSSGEKDLIIKIRGAEKITGSLCRDLDGDGVSELLVNYLATVTNKSSSVSTKPQYLGIYSLKNGKRLRTIKKNVLANGLAVLDINNDKKNDICTYSTKGRTSNINCLSNSKYTTLQSYMVNLKIGQLLGGTYLRDDKGNAVDAFAIAGKKDSTIYVVDSNLQVKFKVSSREIAPIIGQSSAAATLKLSSCN
jgi:Immunoglobulin domain